VSPRKRDSLKKTHYPGVKAEVDDRGRRTGWFELSAKVKHPRKAGYKFLRPLVQAKDDREAAAERAALIQDFLAGNEPERVPTVRQFGLSWLKLKLPTLKHSTRTTYTAAVAEIIAQFGDFYMDGLRVEELGEWRAAFQRRRKRTGKAYSPVTWNGYRRVGRTMFNDAIAQLRPLYLGNPFEQIDPLPEVPHLDDDGIDLGKCLSAKELESLLLAVREVGPQWYPLALMLAFTAMRFGAATALRWPDVDFDGKRILVRRAQVRGHFGTTKTGTTEELHLPDLLAYELRAMRREQVVKQVRGLELGLVFISKAGKPYGGTTALNAALAKAAKHAGLSRKPTVHWFRHTLNNLMRPHAKAEVVRSLTGHLTEEMTAHYSHVSLAEKAAAVNEVVRSVVRLQTFRGGQ